MTHRTQYGTFTLHGTPDGVVHLQGELPEVVAVGHDALRQFWRQEPPLGGPHAELKMPAGGHDAVLHVTTPEAVFTYERFQLAQDKDGPYHLMRLTFTDSTYHAFLAGH